MTSIPNFAPGCFGSALAYQEEHPVCRGCKFAEQCRPMHEENLARLRAELHVKDKRQRFEMTRPTESNPSPGAKVLPKKVREYCERLDRMRLNVTGNLAAGVNPFSPNSMSFLYVAAHLLMKLSKLDKPLRANLLTDAYVHKLKCRESTAEAYARMALQIFQHIGAVDEIDGGFTLRRQ